MEGSDERNNSDKKHEATSTASERAWTNINRDSLHRAISTRISQAIQSRIASGKITTAEADELRGVYSELLGGVIDDVLTHMPNKFNHKLSQQEQEEAVEEVMDQVTLYATEHILQRRS